MNKEELERHKLELEIKNLSRSWVFKLEFWKVAIPSFAVILSIFITYQSGILDFEKSKLSLEKAELRNEIADFQQQKNDLALELEKGDSTKIVLKHKIAFYRKKEQELLSKLEILGEKVNVTDKEKEALKVSFDKKRELYLGKLKENYDAEKKRLTSIDELKRTNWNKESQLRLLRAEIEFRKQHSNLSLIEKEKLESLLRDVNLELFDESMENSKNEIKQLNKEMEINKKRIENMSSEELRNQFEFLFLEYEWEKGDK